MQITTKGQVTMPQEIRNRLGLLPHTKVEFELAGDHARIRKARRPPGESVRGHLALSTTGVTATIAGVAPGVAAAQVRVSTATCSYIPQTQVTVQKPGQLYILGDSYPILNNCPNTKYRLITYQVQTGGGTLGVDIKTDTQTKDTFSLVGNNTCNTGQKNSTSCSTDTGGQFQDQLSVNCNTVGGSCGFTNTNQQWQWCPPNGSASQVIATIGDLVVHNHGISVGGSFTVYPKGTIFGPSGKIQ